jgi:hypothetical protein
LHFKLATFRTVVINRWILVEPLLPNWQVLDVLRVYGVELLFNAEQTVETGLAEEVSALPAASAINASRGLAVLGVILLGTERATARADAGHIRYAREAAPN